MKQYEASLYLKSIPGVRFSVTNPSTIRVNSTIVVENGFFEVPFDLSNNGTWGFAASWAGDDQHYGAESNEVTVEAMPVEP